MNASQKALLARLREVIEHTPNSGALNAGGRPLHVTRFSQAVERRANDGEKLVQYIHSKIYEPQTESYTALIKAGRPDLTVEALVADPDAPWASEFTDSDRATASERLGAMAEAHRDALAASEAAAEAKDLDLVADVNARRVAKGRPRMTSEQEAEMLSKLAAKRS